jgi:exodeoxyribonuclease VII small subunit
MRKAKNFEEALANLESIVVALEEGDIGLEDSLKRYKEGMELHAYCQSRLRHVEVELMKVLGDEADAQEAQSDVPFAEPAEDDDEQLQTGELPF